MQVVLLHQAILIMQSYEVYDIFYNVKNKLALSFNKSPYITNVDLVLSDVQ